MSMTVYTLVNPSDAWTFLAPSDKIAFLVSLYVGGGKTPASRDGWESPFYLMGGDPDKDYEKAFGEPFDKALANNADELIESFRSFMISRHKSPEPLTGEALAKWNDQKRSSLSDFGAYALKLARRIEEKKVKA